MGPGDGSGPESRAWIFESCSQPSPGGDLGRFPDFGIPFLSGKRMGFFSAVGERIPVSDPPGSPRCTAALVTMSRFPDRTSESMLFVQQK